MAFYRSNQGNIQVTVPGVYGDTVSWDTAEGGEATVEANYYLPGGMQPGFDLGNIPKRSPMTVKRLWSDALFSAYIALDSVAGSYPATVAYQLLAADRKTPVGNPISYSGTLGSVTRPGYDSMSGAPAFLQLVINVNEVIAG